MSSEYDRILRREFGRKTGVTPAAARERAQLLEQQSDEASSRDAGERMREAAGALRDYAADEEQGAEERYEEEPTSDAPRAASDKPRSAPKKRGRVGRATDRELVDRPGAAIASGAGLFWRVVVLTLAIVLLGVLLRSSSKTVALLDAAGYWTTRIVYPKGAFGNYADRLNGRRPTTGKPAPGKPAPPTRRNP